MKKIFFAKYVSMLLFMFGCVLLTYGQVKESSLWGPNGVNWDPAGRLPDFSYAGYKSSNVSIPNVPVVANLNSTSALPDDNIDDTSALQSLIDQQATLPRNQRGAIFIPKGRWVIDNQLELNVSGVVLRGEVDSNGKPLTTFYFPDGTASTTSFHIRMRGQFETIDVGNVSSNVEQGENVFNVTGGSSLNVGDFIQLEQQDSADDSFSSYIHGNIDAIGPSTKDLFIYPKIFYWYAYVTSVNGNTITFDRPLPIELKTEWNPFIRKMNMDTTTSEMGVENISFVCNNDVVFVHNDYMGFRIMELNEVINCWVKNVELVDLEYGIRIHRKSAHNTVSGVLIRDEQRNVPLPAVEPKSTFINRMKQRAGGGHHPLEVFQGFYNLFEDFEFKDIHWHELSVEGVAAFNVFRNGKGIAIAFDNHRNAPYANLWTNIDIGRPERLWFNSGSNQIGVPGRERGPNAGFRTTYWNITYENVVPDIEIEPASTDGFAFLNYIGVEGARKQSAPLDKVNSQLVEVAGVGESIAQPDLFIAQLNRRSSPTIANNFTIETLGETCLDKKNGSITINALVGSDYVVTVDGQTVNFTNTATIEGLSPGVYDFCISVDGDTFNQCYQATIESGASLTGKINIDKKKATVNITKGTAPYTVLKNGVAVLETNNASFEIDIQHGDDLQITSKAACQGKLEKQINLLENLKAYPNPSSGEFELFIPANLTSIHLEVYNTQSQLILSKIHKVNNGVVRLDISDKPNGIYFLRVNSEEPSFIKLVKK
ncbi:T9SS type A sorting domain-containing protein [Seonamhaeicola sediminis]|uniref:T9SS type A sorting domain-containing protein n=1 Tax=Seonamhaeicola sediminis TaxID=2528206 RepID=A0A562YIR5_9FLAO|nr:T9SS type A sorting domain-containing protein [Seonamhaeicola sediminis]TWO34579.1 T9SS type A sorting domain-containing protein [Seonamhaeicola sediminis]